MQTILGYINSHYDELKVKVDADEAIIRITIGADSFDIWKNVDDANVENPIVSVKIEQVPNLFQIVQSDSLDNSKASLHCLMRNLIFDEEKLSKADREYLFQWYTDYIDTLKPTYMRK